MTETQELTKALHRMTDATEELVGQLKMRPISVAGEQASMPWPSWMVRGFGPIRPGYGPIISTQQLIDLWSPAESEQSVDRSLEKIKLELLTYSQGSLSIEWLDGQDDDRVRALHTAALEIEEKKRQRSTDIWRPSEQPHDLAARHVSNAIDADDSGMFVPHPNHVDVAAKTPAN